jgi:hypothetical protein
MKKSPIYYSDRVSNSLAEPYSYLSPRCSNGVPSLVGARSLAKLLFHRQTGTESRTQPNIYIRVGFYRRDGRMCYVPLIETLSAKSYVCFFTTHGNVNLARRSIIRDLDNLTYLETIKEECI